MVTTSQGFFFRAKKKALRFGGPFAVQIFDLKSMQEGFSLASLWFYAFKPKRSKYLI